jgi:hypothetical protein
MERLLKSASQHHQFQLGTSSRHLGKGKKCQAILVTDRVGPYGCEMLWFVYFPDNQLTDGSKFVSLTHRPPFTSRKISGIYFC